MDFLSDLFDVGGSFLTDSAFDLGDWFKDFFSTDSIIPSGAERTIDSTMVFNPDSGNWINPDYFGGGSSILPGEWDWMKGGELGGFDIPGLPQIGTGILQYLRNKDTADNAEKAAKKGAQVQDPFGSQRAYYQGELKKLYTDPDYLKRMPGFLAAYNQGLDSVRKTNAAKGYRDSGNVMFDIMNYGNTFMNERFDKVGGALAQLAGAQFGPSGSGDLIFKGAQNADNARSAALAALVDPWKKAAAEGNMKRDIDNYGLGFL